MKTFFKDIIDKNVLFGKTIVGQQNKEIFTFIDKDQIAARNVTPLHSELDSSFKYVDHYKKDAQHYDYFKLI